MHACVILALAGARFQPGFANQSPWLHILFIEWPISLAPALFTYFLPGVLGYRRGGMAKLGAGFSLLFTLLLPLQQVFAAWGRWYPRIHPWLFGVFYVYAAAGLALCGVGLYDHKPRTKWALLAVGSLVAGALVDTAIWLGLFGGVPAVPFGFIGFWAFIVIGFLQPAGDGEDPSDLRRSASDLRRNLTRRSRSISRKLLREGELHMFPVYWVLNRSELGHEGIASSGSWRFADHIYRNEAAGRGAFGRWLDGKLLALPATQAFRRRYLRAQEEVRRALASFPEGGSALRVLAVPCGLPRDLRELAATLEREDPALLSRLEVHGMDLDPEVLDRGRALLSGSGIPVARFHQGNALIAEDYPEGPFHAVVSTGLGEFLSERELAVFYRNVCSVLADGGTFYTSATRREPRSDALMRPFELITQYRTTSDVEAVLRQLPWTRLTLVQDDTGLQTFVVAVR